MNDRVEPLLNRIKQLEIDLQVARTNANHWKGRFEKSQNRTPAANSIVFELSPDLHGALYREATLRYSKVDGFARKLIEAVVKDKLYKAVLDQ